MWQLNQLRLRPFLGFLLLEPIRVNMFMDIFSFPLGLKAY